MDGAGWRVGDGGDVGGSAEGGVTITVSHELTPTAQHERREDGSGQAMVAESAEGEARGGNGGGGSLAVGDLRSTKPTQGHGHGRSASRASALSVGSINSGSGGYFQSGVPVDPHEPIRGHTIVLGGEAANVERPPTTHLSANSAPPLATKLDALSSRLANLSSTLDSDIARSALFRQRVKLFSNEIEDWLRREAAQDWEAIQQDVARRMLDAGLGPPPSATSSAPFPSSTIPLPPNNVDHTSLPASVTLTASTPSTAVNSPARHSESHISLLSNSTTPQPVVSAPPSPPPAPPLATPVPPHPEPIFHSANTPTTDSLPPSSSPPLSPPTSPPPLPLSPSSPPQPLSRRLSNSSQLTHRTARTFRTFRTHRTYATLRSIPDFNVSAETILERLGRLEELGDWSWEVDGVSGDEADPDGPLSGDEDDPHPGWDSESEPSTPHPFSPAATDTTSVPEDGSATFPPGTPSPGESIPGAFPPTPDRQSAEVTGALSPVPFSDRRPSVRSARALPVPPTPIPPTDTSTKPELAASPTSATQPTSSPAITPSLAPPRPRTNRSRSVTRLLAVLGFVEEPPSDTSPPGHRKRPSRGAKGEKPVISDPVKAQGTDSLGRVVGAVAPWVAPPETETAAPPPPTTSTTAVAPSLVPAQVRDTPSPQSTMVDETPPLAHPFGPRPLGVRRASKSSRTSMSGRGLTGTQGIPQVPESAEALLEKLKELDGEWDMVAGGAAEEDLEQIKAATSDGYGADGYKTSANQSAKEGLRETSIDATVSNVSPVPTDPGDTSSVVPHTYPAFSLPLLSPRPPPTRPAPPVRRGSKKESVGLEVPGEKDKEGGRKTRSRSVTRLLAAFGLGAVDESNGGARRDSTSTRQGKSRPSSRASSPALRGSTTLNTPTPGGHPVSHLPSLVGETSGRTSTQETRDDKTNGGNPANPETTLSFAQLVDLRPFAAPSPVPNVEPGGGLSGPEQGNTMSGSEVQTPTQLNASPSSSSYTPNMGGSSIPLHPFTTQPPTTWILPPLHATAVPGTTTTSEDDFAAVVLAAALSADRASLRSVSPVAGFAGQYAGESRASQVQTPGRSAASPVPMSPTIPASPTSPSGGSFAGMLPSHLTTPPTRKDSLRNRLETNGSGGHAAASYRLSLVHRPSNASVRQTMYAQQMQGQGQVYNQDWGFASVVPPFSAPTDGLGNGQSQGDPLADGALNGNGGTERSASGGNLTRSNTVSTIATVSSGVTGSVSGSSSRPVGASSSPVPIVPRTPTRSVTGGSVAGTSLVSALKPTTPVSGDLVPPRSHSMTRLGSEYLFRIRAESEAGDSGSEMGESDVGEEEEGGREHEETRRGRRRSSRPRSGWWWGGGEKSEKGDGEKKGQQRDEIKVKEKEPKRGRLFWRRGRSRSGSREDKASRGRPSQDFGMVEPKKFGNKVPGVPVDEVPPTLPANTLDEEGRKSRMSRRSLSRKSNKSTKSNKSMGDGLLEPPRLDTSGASALGSEPRTRSQEQRWGVSRMVKAVASAVTGGGGRKDKPREGADKEEEEASTPTSSVPSVTNSSTMSAGADGARKGRQNVPSEATISMYRMPFYAGS
ncbi:hypothetical protein M427DRAFT_173277 [Gonapodya prolifera JEL478]|uniref:Uncharacterized protein n=1 Tax=Gonapodya prolifera (strain JEL478) TaxID=1344416 RepID=A0A139B0E4_GONPJ|nr:hypothetical protein M427DRAFT_173277 [Gonapodya prolifera JEL478]|eukprot:KXS22466.1 hypothetical protein M427DRAFT_173277 [Gonapodya prolifera JEL478]